MSFEPYPEPGYGFIFSSDVTKMTADGHYD